MSQIPKKHQPEPETGQQKPESDWLKWSLDPDVARKSDRIWLALDDFNPQDPVCENQTVNRDELGHPPNKYHLNWMVAAIVLGLVILAIIGLILFLPG